MNDLTVFLMLALIPLYVGFALFIEWLAGYISDKIFMKKILKKHLKNYVKEQNENENKNNSKTK